MALPPKPSVTPWSPSAEIMDAINNITVYVPDEAGNPVATKLPLGKQFSASEVGELSAQAVILALAHDAQFAEATKDFQAEPGPQITPSGYKDRQKLYTDLNNLTSGIYQWLATGNSEGTVTHKNGDGDAEVSTDNQKWLEKNPSIAQAMLADAVNTKVPAAVSTQYMINDGRGSGYNFKWYQQYKVYRNRANPQGQNLVNSSLITPDILRRGLKVIDAPSIPAYAPYFDGGLTGVEYTLPQLYHQTQVDNGFLLGRAVQIYTTIRADRERRTNPNLQEGESAQIDAERIELEQLRQQLEQEGKLEGDDLARFNRLNDTFGSTAAVKDVNAFVNDQADGGEDYASEFRSKEQCFLLTKIISLAKANMSRRVNYDTDSDGPKAYCVQGKPSELVSALTYDPNYSSYYLMPPSKLSYLVPSVKLGKLCSNHVIVVEMI